MFEACLFGRDNPLTVVKRRDEKIQSAPYNVNYPVLQCCWMQSNQIKLTQGLSQWELICL